MNKTMRSPKERNEPLRVIVVSSNHMTRVGLRTILDAHPNVSLVGELSGDTNAVEVAGQKKPEVILIDVDLTGVGLLDLIGKLRAAAKDSQILILCGLDNEQLTREALCSGAAGVVLKIQPPGVLIAAIEDLCNDAPKTILSQSIQPVSSLMSNMDSVKKNGSAPPQIVASLTARERGVIALIGEGLRNKDIADRLCISETTVRHHLTSIFNKLEVSTRQKLLIVAHQYGLVELKPREFV